MQKIRLTLKRQSDSPSDKTSEESGSEISPAKKLKITLPGALIYQSSTKTQLSEEESDWPEVLNPWIKEEEFNVSLDYLSSLFLEPDTISVIGNLDNLVE